MTKPIADERIKQDREIADERAQDAALQAYLEQMSKLLLDKDKPLRESVEGSEARSIARAWTLTILRRLKGERKAVLLRFLYEADLIMSENTMVSLVGANLSEAILLGADLKGANLMGAELERAALSGANLRVSNLAAAKLEGAYLKDAKLERAYLGGTKLARAYLGGAEYDGVTVWPEGFNPQEAGPVLVTEEDK